MTITPATRARLAQLVEAELNLLERLSAVLAHEQELLIAGDADALVTLTTDKSTLYRGLQDCHDGIALLLGQVGLQPSAESIRQLAKDLPETLERWERIRLLGSEVRTQNELNGKLIVERMQHNQAALTALLAAADQPALYDAAGTARPGSRGRHLGSA